MSKEFRNLLAETITVVEPFRDEIQFILMKKTREGDIALVGKSKSSSIEITALSKHDLPDFEGVACFGSVSYLGAILKSKYLKNGSFSMEVEYKERKDYNTKSVFSILFESEDEKFQAFYQATDPFVNKMNRIKPLNITNWPVSFTITQDFIKDFNEIIKVHKSGPKLGGDRDDLFTLSFSNGNIVAIFGEKGHRSNLVLCDNAVGKDVDTISALLNISLFQSILKLIGKGDAKARFTSTALKIDIDNDAATYSLTIAAKKRSV